jgi:hypothetical protein
VLRPKVAYLHQIAACPLATPASAQILTLIDKHPVTGGIGTDLQTSRRRSNQEIDPGSGDLSEHCVPAFLQRHHLETHSALCAPDLACHGGDCQKDVELLDLSLSDLLVGSNGLEHLAQQLP